MRNLFNLLQSRNLISSRGVNLRAVMALIQTNHFLLITIRISCLITPTSCIMGVLRKITNHLMVTLSIALKNSVMIILELLLTQSS